MAFITQNLKFITEVVELPAPRPLTTTTSPHKFIAKRYLSTEDHKRRAYHRWMESEEEIRDGKYGDEKYDGEKYGDEKHDGEKYDDENGGGESKNPGIGDSEIKGREFGFTSTR